LHPSSTLIAWLAAVISIQFMGYVGLGLFGLSLVLSVSLIARPWLDYVWRARWLLLMLWIILAYNTPGDALHDVAWAPTYQGLAEANLHLLRLVLVLGCLAWLFRRLSEDQLLSALWGVLLPLERLGVDAERLLVRLALVLENLQVPLEKGAWKKILAAQPDFPLGPGVMRLTQPAWHRVDALGLIFVIALFVGAVVV
jgi:energy-coupling factor transporter transmembrane protein EcfT